MFALDNPYPFYASQRVQSPVAQLGGSSFHLVTSWDLIAEVVARPESFSSNLTATMVWHDDGSVSEFPIAEMGSPLHVLATADDPDHRAHRTMVMPRLIAKRMAELEPFIESTCRRLWADGLRDDHIDWVHDVAEQLPMAVVVELLGLPDHDIDTLVRWVFASTALLDGVVTKSQLAEATDAVGELATYLSGAFTGAVANPGDNVLGDVARQVNAGAIDHDTAVMILIQLVAAGAESTISVLGTSVWLLGQHDDVQARLRADRTLVPLFIEESLRLESPLRGHFRHVVDDTTLGEVRLPAGSHLYLAWGQPTVIQPGSPILTTSASIRQTDARTWLSARDCTSVSARPWPASRPGSASRHSSTPQPDSRSTPTAGDGHTACCPDAWRPYR